MRSIRALGIRGSAAVAMMSLGACASFTSQQKGAMIGAATGAVAGGAIGKANGSTAKGAIIGAMVGGVAGGIIGRQMDKQAAQIAQKIPGATVERVGEGIQVTFESGLLYDFDSDRVRADAGTNLRNLAASLDEYPNTDLLYDFDSDRVRADAGTNLRNLAASLDEYPNTDLLIVGHTDSDGPGEYNEDLSSRRARAAADYLESRGVARRRLRTAGRGEREPVSSNDSEPGRERNRRVEVAIYASEAYRSQLSGR